MGMEEIKDRASFVACGDEVWRISYNYEKENGALNVRIDVHGLDVFHAIRTIKNIVSLFRCRLNICVIHGYNSGTAIKNSLRKNQYGSRFEGMESPAFNPGVTNMRFAPSC